MPRRSIEPIRENVLLDTTTLYRIIPVEDGEYSIGTARHSARAGENVVIDGYMNQNVDSTSSITGAFKIVGGIGVAKDLFVETNVKITTTGEVIRVLHKIGYKNHTVLDSNKFVISNPKKKEEIWHVYDISETISDNKCTYYCIVNSPMMYVITPSEYNKLTDKSIKYLEKNSMHLIDDIFEKDAYSRIEKKRYSEIDSYSGFVTGDWGYVEQNSSVPAAPITRWDEYVPTSPIQSVESAVNSLYDIRPNTTYVGSNAERIINGTHTNAQVHIDEYPRITR